MHTSVKSYTTESILASLGYPDPLVAARQHARRNWVFSVVTLEDGETVLKQQVLRYRYSASKDAA